MRIELRVLGEDFVDRSHLVGELRRSEVVVRHLFEVSATTSHAAIVDMEDGVAVLGEELVEVKALAAPAVARGVNTGTTVGVDDERDAVGLSLIHI